LHLSIRQPSDIQVFKTVKAALALNPKTAFGFRSATDAKMLTNPKPRAICQHFVVPPIQRREVARAEWPNVRRFEHFL
jgi:hypothetical protein